MRRYGRKLKNNPQWSIITDTIPESESAEGAILQLSTHNTLKGTLISALQLLMTPKTFVSSL